MAKKTITYTEALAEVERILERIQREEITVDDLASEVKRAATLIAGCRTRLRKAEEEVGKLLE